MCAYVENGVGTLIELYLYFNGLIWFYKHLAEKFFLLCIFYTSIRTFVTPLKYCTQNQRSMSADIATGRSALLQRSRVQNVCEETDYPHGL
jgi:hypothetical protein